MSQAPDSLKALRRYLAEKTGKPRENFGIRGSVGPKRNSGYHLGKVDIFGPGGLGDKDYSIRRPRDKAGLSDASSGFDIKLPVPELKRLLQYLVTEAKAKRADLMEIIGPGPDGRAYDHRKPLWTPIGPRAPKDGHEWHIHVSFPRDTEFRDRVAMFEGFYGPQAEEPEPEPIPEEPPEPAPEPLPPTIPELEAEIARLQGVLDAAAELQPRVIEEAQRVQRVLTE